MNQELKNYYFNMWKDLVFPELDRYLILNKHEIRTLVEVLEALDYEMFEEMQA